MTSSNIARKIKSIFIQHFKIDAAIFDMDQPLEVLHEDFKILSNLVFLEQILQEEFNQSIPLLENISTAFHTPNDIVKLIIENN